MDSALDPNWPSAPELRAGAFLNESLRLYRRGFWLFVKIIVPPVLFAAVAAALGGHLVATIVPYVPLDFDYIAQNRLKFMKGYAAILGTSWFGWLVYCFAFGAVCIAVRELRHGRVPTAEECYAPARERIGAVMRLGTLLYFLWVAAIAFLIAISYVVVLTPVGRQVGVPVMYLLMAVFAVLLSRFGLAMPAVLFDGCNVRQAMFRSDEYTEGRWTILAALLLKSVGGSLLAVLVALLVADLLPETLAAEQLEWILYGLVLVGMVLVQPHMFIGFALLYSKTAEAKAPARTALSASSG